MKEETLLQQIERHEGKKRVMYEDSMGIPTIGIGHNLSKPLSDAAIQQILRDDLNDAMSECLHAFPWYAELTEPRQWAMIDMCFNMGLPRLLGFKKFIQAMA